MVFLMFLQHEWSVTSMRLKTKNPKVHFHPNDNLTTQHDTLINNPVTSTTDTPINIYSRINYPFPPPSS